MILCKWQVFANEVFIGETSNFPYVDANRDDITQERWQLMSKAREMYPSSVYPGYTYRLVKSDDQDRTRTSQPLDITSNEDSNESPNL